MKQTPDGLNGAGGPPRIARKAEEILAKKTDRVCDPTHGNTDATSPETPACVEHRLLQLGHRQGNGKDDEGEAAILGFTGP